VVSWASYNESLVRRGEIILDFDIINSWDSELDKMNDGKKGAAYDYHDSCTITRLYESIFPSTFSTN
jgi:hypothetical protein